MRILVCGDRDWTDHDFIRKTLESYLKSGVGHVVITGGARGADACAFDATEGLAYVQVFPADWDTYGKAAGPIRNKKMLEEGRPDLVLAFHDDIDASKGTKHMVKIARAAGVETLVLSHPPWQQAKSRGGK